MVMVERASPGIAIGERVVSVDDEPSTWDVVDLLQFLAACASINTLASMRGASPSIAIDVPTM